MTISVDRDVRVTMPDGIRLAADVFRPAGGGRHPVVVLRTPYDRGGAAAFGLQINALRLAEAGYAVVTQDVRGRFGSEGDFEPFRAEAADGVATIHWAAEQPWSTGVVAMAGMSYCGYAQVLAARERPEPLRAWIPAFCPLDARTEWVHEGGAFSLAFNLALSLASFAGPDRRTERPADVLAALDDWEASVRRGADDQPALLSTPAAGARRPRRVARASRRCRLVGAAERAGAGAHDAAALVIGGWFDIFHRGTLSLHAELAAGQRALDPPRHGAVGSLAAAAGLGLGRRRVRLAGDRRPARAVARLARPRRCATVHLRWRAPRGPSRPARTSGSTGTPGRRPTPRSEPSRRPPTARSSRVRPRPA